MCVGTTSLFCALSACFILGDARNTFTPLHTFFSIVFRFRYYTNLVYRTKTSLRITLSSPPLPLLPSLLQRQNNRAQRKNPPSEPPLHPLPVFKRCQSHHNPPHSSQYSPHQTMPFLIAALHLTSINANQGLFSPLNRPTTHTHINCLCVIFSLISV